MKYKDSRGNVVKITCFPTGGVNLSKLTIEVFAEHFKDQKYTSYQRIKFVGTHAYRSFEQDFEWTNIMNLIDILTRYMTPFEARLCIQENAAVRYVAA